MTQTGYTGLNSAPETNLPIDGGFCRWYFIQRDLIELWSFIDPATQILQGEPMLKSGYQWYGSVKVPDHSVGFEETEQRDKPGIYYKQKVSGYLPSDSQYNRILLENLAYYEVIVVGQLRGSGIWLILGNMDYGLTLQHT